MSTVSDAVLRSEQASPRDPAAQALVWAYNLELPRGSVYAGGKNLPQPPLRIAVTTPERALDGDRNGYRNARIGRSPPST